MLLCRSTPPPVRIEGKEENSNVEDDTQSTQSIRLICHWWFCINSIALISGGRILKILGLQKKMFKLQWGRMEKVSVSICNCQKKIISVHRLVRNLIFLQEFILVKLIHLQFVRIFHIFQFLKLLSIRSKFSTCIFATLFFITLHSGALLKRILFFTPGL
jgi:hypothetical protein